MKPLHNRLIVRPQPQERLRASGILLPESTEKPMAGEIVAKGPDATQVSVGERIMFGKYAQQPFAHEGETLLSMCEMDVLFVMEE